MHGSDQLKSLYEEVNEKLLAMFYKEPATYAFAMQMFMIISRIRSYDLWKIAGLVKPPSVPTANPAVDVVAGTGMVAGNEVNRAPKKPTQPRTWLFDRSLLGDYVFALVNYITGNLQRDQFETYVSEYNRHMPLDNKVPNLRKLPHSVIVLLEDEPTNCRERVHLERGNLSERDIPLSYFQLLDDVYFHVFVRNLFAQEATSECLVKTWWQYYDNDVLTWWHGTVQPQVANGPVVPRVQYCTLSHESVRTLTITQPTAFVYSKEDVLEGIYAFLRKADQVAHTVSYNAMLAKPVDEKSSWHALLPCMCRTCRNPMAWACGTPTYGHILAQLAAQPNVYISDYLMRIDTSARTEVQEERMDELHMVFYKNAYKRVVMWHLSRGQRIHFYKIC